MFKSFAFLAAFAATPALADDHSPLEFAIEGNAIFAWGDIDGNSLADFQDVLSEGPSIRILVLEYIGGSVDDEANVEFGRAIRNMGFTTVVPSEGLVASGGTDLFLAGANRILEAGACVGVHSWAADSFTATDLPRSDAEHKRYLNYYDDIRISQDFYWFTIQAAPANGMHWMTANEANRFNMASGKASSLGAASSCDRR